MGKSKQRYDMLSWAVRLEGRSLWSENANPGVSVYGESLRKVFGANTVDGTQLGPNWLLQLCELSEINHCFCQLLVQRYCILERATASISHLHDHLCGADNDLNGRIVAVDLAPRCLRDLTHLASARPGLVAILGDVEPLDGAY